MSCLGFSTSHMAETLELTRAHVNVLINQICRKAHITRKQLSIFALMNPVATVKGGKCKPGLHPRDCPCDAPLCWGRRRVAERVAA
jgi:hypothetical protein